MFEAQGGGFNVTELYQDLNSSSVPNSFQRSIAVSVLLSGFHGIEFHS